MSLKNWTIRTPQWIRHLVENYANAPGRSCAASLIGWLSVVMLAAAWGTELSSELRVLWKDFGLLGLAAAIGLETTRRARLFRTMRHGPKPLHQRVMEVLTRLAAEGASTDEIRNSLRWIAEAMQEGGLRDGLRTHVRIPVEIPVLLTPVGRRHVGKQGVKASICELSATGVGLLHRDPIVDRKVSLTFDLLDADQLDVHSMALIVEFHWSQRQVDGTYASGGKVIDIRTHANYIPREPNDEPQESELVTAHADS